MKHDIPGAAAWSAPVRAGRSITLTALADDTNASVLIIGADRLDRLNVPDTLKSQMSARIRAGLVLMSDRGLALATVVASTLDWHDCLTGCVPDRLLTIELAKHGFGPADLHGCINFFSKVAIADDARASLTYEPDHARAGDTVTLRAEQDLLIFISTAPHPLANQDDREGPLRQAPTTDVPHTNQPAGIIPTDRPAGATPSNQLPVNRALTDEAAVGVAPSNQPPGLIPSNQPTIGVELTDQSSGGVALTGQRGGGVAVRIEAASDGEDPELREEALRALELTRELIA